MPRRFHLASISRAPRQAQTVQQLKYDTLLVYLNNGLTIVFGLFSTLGETSNALENFPGTLPYKGWFSGGGDTTTS